MNNWRWKGIFTVGTLVLGVLSGMAWAAVDNDGCTVATLKGDYGFRAVGPELSPVGTPTTIAVIGMIDFDGKGNFTQVDYQADGIAMGVTDFRMGETGTYTLNADCTGRAEIDLNVPVPAGSHGVIKLMFVVTNQGNAIHAVVAEFIPPGATQSVRNSVYSDFWKVGSISDQQ